MKPQRTILVYVSGEGCYRLHQGVTPRLAWGKRISMRRRSRVLRAVLFADDPRCRYCRREIPTFDQATLDHIQPTSRGGSTCRANLALCCADCNGHKRNLTLPEWRAVLEEMLQSVRTMEREVAV